MSLAMVRLARSFDSELLKKELRCVPEAYGKPAGYSGENHKDWTALTLFSSSKHTVEMLAAGYWPLQQPPADEDAPRDLLMQMPYYRHVLSSLGCPIEMARLMTLRSGGVIAEHRDAIIGFAEGLVRLHVPVVTRPEVEMFIDDMRCNWNEGELWYGDFSRPHKAVNRSLTTRVHLVIDVRVEGTTWSLFPSEFPRSSISSSVPSESLQRFSCSFKLPAGFALPGLTPLTEPAIANIRPLASDLAIWVDDQPLLKLRAKADGSMTILGLPIRAELSFAGAAGEIEFATLRLAEPACEFSFPVSRTAEA